MFSSHDLPTWKPTRPHIITGVGGQGGLWALTPQSCGVTPQGDVFHRHSTANYRVKEATLELTASKKRDLSKGLTSDKDPNIHTASVDNLSSAFPKSHWEIWGNCGGNHFLCVRAHVPVWTHACSWGNYFPRMIFIIFFLPFYPLYSFSNNHCFLATTAPLATILKLILAMATQPEYIPAFVFVDLFNLLCFLWYCNFL